MKLYYHPYSQPSRTSVAVAKQIGLEIELEKVDLMKGAQREVEYLVRNEWAMSADDILWRRTKLGLRLTAEEAGHLEQWLGDHRAALARSVA